MNIVLASIASLFIGNTPMYGYYPQPLQLQPFDPEWLNDTRIEYVTPCSGLICLFMAKDGEIYLVVVDSQNQTQFVYRFVGTFFDLLWTREKELR